MKLSLAVAAATIASICSAVEFHSSAKIIAAEQSKGFIIELEPGSKFAKRRVDAHAEFHKTARDVLSGYAVRHEFKNQDLFYGLSIDAPEDTSIQALLALPGVKNAWKNLIVERPGPIGVDYIPHQESKAMRKGPGGVVHVNGTSDINGPRKMTGVYQLHELGIKGKGIKVGIVDTGIDYTHPSIGGGFGPGYKVVGGRDLVGDDFDGRNEAIPDSDPMVNCLIGGHGTHVGGIIAGQDPEGVGFGFIGVAPEATLYMYRIFGCTGGTSFDMILQAFEAALADGVDVISLSLGAIQSFDTASSLLAAIKAKGIAIIVANGNVGDQLGPYFPSYPAVDRTAVSVGSVSSLNFPTLYNAVDTAGNTIEYARVAPIDEAAGPFNIFLADDGPGTTCNAQAWEDAASGFPDPSKVIVLLSYGSWCQSEMESWYLPATGFSKVLFTADANYDLRLPPSGYVWYEQIFIFEDSFKKIQSGISEHGNAYILEFKDSLVHDMQQVTGGSMSAFSSYGPTIEMSMKPQISAPGGSILSLWPTGDGVGYAVASGTSMATPHIAGCFALLKSAFPSLGPDEILQLLQSTSTPIDRLGMARYLTSTTQQGSGLVNVYKAFLAQSETVLSTNELNLRDSATPAPQTITIENRSSRPKTYTVSHKGASLINATPNAYTKEWSDEKFWWVENNSPTYASVTFSSDKVVVDAGATASFVASVSAPKDIDAGLLPVYGGYIIVTDDVADYVVPYVGVPYSRGDYSTIDFTDIIQREIPGPAPPQGKGIPNIPAIYAANTYQRNNDLMTFDFGSETYNIPTVIFVIRQPSSYVRIDVVHPHQRVHPNAYGFDRCNRFDTIDPAVDPVDNFLGLPSYGEVISFAGGDDKPKSPTQFPFNGFGYIYSTWHQPEVSGSNGTKFLLPNADYRLLMRALKSGHNWNDTEGYESWLSPIIRINMTTVN